MKIISLCLLIISFLIEPINSQEIYSISGRAFFHPNLSTLNVDLELSFYVDGIKRGNSEVINNSPYRFSASIPKKETDNEVVIKVTVYSPKNYIANQEEYYYQGTDVQMHFRNKNDVYFVNLNKADKLLKEKKYDKSKNILSDLLEREVYTTNNQKYEIYKTSAHILNEEKDYSGAIETYGSMFNQIDFNSLNRAQINNYFKERLDAFLYFTDFYKQKIPEVDFGYIVDTLNQNNIKENWRNLIEEYASYSGSDTLLNLNELNIDNPQKISEQLKIMKSQLFR